MKTILLFMPYGAVGGMERLALSFYDYYKSKGFRVIGLKIIGLGNDIISFGEDEMVLSRKDFYEYSRFDRLKFYLKIPFLLKKIILHEKVDYTISFGDMANSFSALSQTKEKKIGSIHALKSVELVANSPMNRLFRLSYKTIYKKLDKVVCISQSIEKDLKQNLHYKFDNLEVIYNPHDISKIVQLSKEHIEEDDELRLFKENKIILFLGRLSIQKSPWHLVNAFHLFNNPAYKLVFIGDGDQKVIDLVNKIIKKHNLQDKVIFLGRKSNPYKYLKASSMLALSSLYEGTPNVIVEAIALGIPVISSDCTKGVEEMMVSNKSFIEESLQITNAGLITPTFFKSNIGLPELTKSEFIEEEYVFARGLKFIQDNYSNVINNLNNSKLDLLSKFDLDVVCNKYLS